MYSIALILLNLYALFSRLSASGDDAWEYMAVYDIEHADHSYSLNLPHNGIDDVMVRASGENFIM